MKGEEKKLEECRKGRSKKGKMEDEEAKEKEHKMELERFGNEKKAS